MSINNLSRRSFLKGAAAVSLAAAASGILAGCSVSDIPGMTGGVTVVGAKTGAFVIKAEEEGEGEDEVITVAITDAQNYEYFTNLLIKAKISNGMAEEELSVVETKTSSGYEIVPTVKLLGEEEVEAEMAEENAVKCDAISAGKDGEAEFLINTGIKGWQAIELTLTLTNDGSEVEGAEPIVFTFRK